MQLTSYSACVRLWFSSTFASSVRSRIVTSWPSAYSRPARTDRLLHLPLHKTGRERPERLVQKVVLAVANAELERVDRDLHILDLL